MFKTKPFFFAAAALIALSACGEEDDHDHDDHDHSAETIPVALNFQGVVGDQAFSCEQSYELGSAKTSVQFTDFKLFISDVRLVRQNGDEMPVSMDEDEKWQARGVALIDFEDGKAGCANGTPEINTVIKGKAMMHDDYVGVRFRLGVPFSLNHADVGALPSPLNLPSMFWSWQGGRKFLRVDGKVDQAGLRVHLGSIGCEGEQDNITSCGTPNRPEVELMGMGSDVANGTIKVDLVPLFTDLDLTPVDDKSVICMSAPETPSCGPIFGTLGLAYGEQQATTQTFFKAVTQAQ